MLEFVTDRGVFSRSRVDPGTRLLAEAFEPGGGGTVLDAGCAYGALGIAVAARFPQLRVVMVDLNERAVELCRMNIRRNGVTNARCLVGDGLGAVAPGSLAAVLTNPPVRAGRALLYRWFEEARLRLVPGGSLWVVMRTRQGAQSLMRWLEGRYAAVNVVARGGGYRVLRARNFPGPPPGPGRAPAPAAEPLTGGDGGIGAGRTQSFRRGTLRCSKWPFEADDGCRARCASTAPRMPQ